MQEATSPTAPTAPTPTAPTPTPPSSTCSDSSLRFKLRFQGKNIFRDCIWVARKNTFGRCQPDGVSAMCSSTCGACGTCVDSTNRFRLVWNGKKITRSCIWVKNKLTDKRCKAEGVAEACRETCAMC